MTNWYVSGAEPVDPNEQQIPHPADLHVSGFMPKWMRDYRNQQAQEQKMTDTMTTTIQISTPEDTMTDTIQINTPNITMATTEIEIKEMLYQLGEMEYQKSRIELEKQQMIERIMPPEIIQALADINLEFDSKAEIASGKIEALREKIKAQVLIIGHSVQIDCYQAQWKKGRDNGFDTKMLLGMAKLIPQIIAAKKPDSAPTVSLVPVR